MKNLKTTIFTVTLTLCCLTSVKAQDSKIVKEKTIKSNSCLESTSYGSVQKSNINGINNGMPNRISMNVTVAKQTQGATFGEKVNAGKINVTLVEGGCIVLFPSNEGYRVNTADKSIK